MIDNTVEKQHITDAPHKTTQNICRAGVVFYCFFVSYCALVPFNHWVMPKPDFVNILLYGWIDKIYTFDVIQNLLMYLPMGFFAIFAFGIQRWLMGLTFAFFISLAMCGALEFAQSFNPVRVPSALDIILNTLSGFLGGVIAVLFYEKWMALFHYFGTLLHPVSIRNPMPVICFLMMIAWAAYQWYPYIPTLHPWHLQVGYRPLLSVMLDTSLINLSKVFVYALQVFILYLLALISLKDKQMIVVFCLLMIVLPLKIVLIGRVLSFEAIIGSLLGLTIAYTMHLIAIKWHVASSDRKNTGS